MNLLRYSAIFLLALALIPQGCGDRRPGPQTSADLEQANRMVADLQAKLKQVQDSLGQQRSQNDELIGRLQQLMEGISESDKRREKEFDMIRKSAEDRGQESGRTGSGRSEALGDQQRLALIGAKALAEFKAKQLDLRVDELKKDLDRKEAELRELTDAAQDKDLQVQKLNKQLKELQASEAKRTAELDSRLEQISKDLSDQSAQSKQFKQELDEKSELLAALKNAIGDSARLKSAAEHQISLLQTQLTETTKLLETSKAAAEQQSQELTNTQRQLAQALEEVERWRTLTEQAQQDSEASGQQIDQYKAAMEPTQQAGSQLKVLVDRSKQETEQLRSELERAREETVAFRVDAERAKQEAEQFKAQVAELAKKLQAAQPRTEGDDRTKLSTVDKIIEGTPTDEEQASPSHLY